MKQSILADSLIMRRLLPVLFLMAISYAGTHESLGSCTACHVVRSGRNASLDDSRPSQAPNSAVCVSCHDGTMAPNHDGIQEERVKDPFSRGELRHMKLAFARQSSESGSQDCLRCHHPHMAKATSSLTSTERCRRCHIDR